MSSEYLDQPLWAVIPAAGVGSRMGAMVPKQYLPLAGQCMLQRCVSQILQLPDVAGIVVVLAEEDAHWQSLPASADARVHTCIGGDSRALSVMAGLTHVLQLSSVESWVMVHDAARPLVAVSDIHRLLKAVYNSGSVGGILAVPVSDTLKRSDEYHLIDDTVSRQDLWQAQTPQMFRTGELLEALQSAQQADAKQALITDEASAMEIAGHMPQLVEALEPNLKITRAADLLVAEALLKHREVP